MQGPDFLYFLLNDKNQFYYVNGTTVLTSGLPKPLIFTPDGWQDISIFFERNKKYFAIDRSFSYPMNFVEDGARILKYLFYEQGVEAKCYLLIAEQVLDFDGVTYGFRYQKMYKGEVDFSTFSHQGPKVTVNMMEGDLVKLIKANESTDYEIPLGDDAEVIEMDGLNLQEKGNFNLVSDFEIKKSIFGTNWFLPVNYLGSDGKSTGISFFTQQVKNMTGIPWATKLNDDDYLGLGNDSIVGTTTAIISGVIEFKCTQNSPSLGFRVRFYRSNQALVNQGDYEVVFNGNPRPGNTYTYNVNLSIPLQAGERLYVEGIYFGGITGAIDIGISFTDNCKLSIKYKNTFRATTTKAYRPSVLLQKVLDKVTGGGYQVQSSLLTGDNDLRMLTSGDALRGLSGAVIKTSLMKVFQLFDMQLDAAMGIINNVLHFENKQFWYDHSTIIDLGSVTNLKVNQSGDYLFNTVTIGYPNQNYNQALGDVNGKLEPCVTQSYTLPITCVNKALQLTTDIRADMYGIEFTRINLEGKTTVDSSSDNDTFCIKVAAKASGATNYTLDRSLNPYVSVVIDPSYNMDATTQADLISAYDQAKAFNLLLTPKQCLYNHGAFIRGCLRKLDSKWVRYNVSDKFPLLKVAPPGGRVVYERSDVQVGDFDQPYFDSVQFDFETKTPINLQDILAQNPVQAFRYEYQGVVMDGVNIKVGMQPAIQKSQVWSLLSVPTNNLSQLIEVWI